MKSILLIALIYLLATISIKCPFFLHQGLDLTVECVTTDLMLQDKPQEKRT